MLNALDNHETLLAGENVVWAGDFNASYRFDTADRPYKFSRFGERLRISGLESVCHRQQNCPHGEEREKTFFMHHKPDKRRHTDYIFAREDILARCGKLEIGHAGTWIKRSDHVPLILDVMAQ